jgi:uncharacterized protein YbjT (DUF2867 family)
MKMTVLVAGATGNLGGRIVTALLHRGARVQVIVRPSSDAAKLAEWEQKGVTVIRTELTNVRALKPAFEGVAVVISALQGLGDVIVDTQSTLLDAAVAAGVPRFIPSDFSTDFTQIQEGDNRNFDLRRKFHRYLEQVPIAYTSIFNGAFADILTYNTPTLDLKNSTVGYLEDADWPIDFTTMDNTAAFTAAAALDESTPEKLHIAGIRITPNQLKVLAEKITGKPFEMKFLGSRAEFTAHVRKERAAHPEGEQELYASWQQMQYLLSMFSAPPLALDNDRYPGIEWTNAAKFLASL